MSQGAMVDAIGVYEDPLDLMDEIGLTTPSPEDPPS